MSELEDIKNSLLGAWRMIAATAYSGTPEEQQEAEDYARRLEAKFLACGAGAPTEVEEVHPFEQVPDTDTSVCPCGKWPTHHIHTGNPPTCGCGDCIAERSRQRAGS